jgi:hypothetical protein
MIHISFPKFKMLLFSILVALFACKSSDDISPSAESSGSASSSSGDSTTPAGQMTAGEWNDLDHWNFWQDIIKSEDFKQMPSKWNFNTTNRISVLAEDKDGNACIDCKVTLYKGTELVWQSKTDNFGKAELWPNLHFSMDVYNDLQGYEIKVNDISITTPVLYKDGLNKIISDELTQYNNISEICFVVDATGSMGDELSYVKSELANVIQRISANNQATTFRSASVFYRDEGDEYVTRTSAFTNDHSATIQFIKNQVAGGGGDFPEAVHTALEKSVKEFQWSASAKSRIIFLLLDAPPHANNQVSQSIQASIKLAAEKGIKIIPITASGIDKETEFLMRFFGQTTNGSYVFVTGHSGIGNEHLIPSVGEYQVEYLNDLIVRLIDKYVK